MNSLNLRFVDLVLCLLPLVTFAFSLRRTWIARRWPEIQATVVSCEKAIYPHMYLGGHRLTFLITAEYRIEGSSHQIKFDYSHEIDGTVPIFINPSDPGDFTLKVRDYGYPMLWGMISIVLILCALL